MYSELKSVKLLLAISICIVGNVYRILKVYVRHHFKAFTIKCNTCRHSYIHSVSFTFSISRTQRNMRTKVV